MYCVFFNIGFLLAMIVDENLNLSVNGVCCSSFNQLSEELLVSVKKLKKKASKNELDIYVQNTIEKYGELLEQAKEDYHKIRENYQENNDGRLVSLHTDEVSICSSHHLMRSVRKANKHLLTEQNSDFKVKVKVENNEKKIFHYLAERGAIGELQLCRWSGEGRDIYKLKAKKLFVGKGSCGIAQLVKNISEARINVVKISKNEIGRASIDNEYKKGCALQGVEGIQDSPKALFSIKLNENCIGKGILQSFYNGGNLFDFIEKGGLDELTSIQQKAIGGRLFKALKALHDRKLIHGDIKSENCFVKQVEEDIIVDICDLDIYNVESELLLSKRKELINFNLCEKIAFGTPVTKICFTQSDQDELYKNAINNNQLAWIQNQKQRDIFAMATVVWHVLSEDFPFYEKGIVSDTSNYPDNSELIEEEQGEDIVNILEQALSESPYDRPSLDEIIEVFK